MGHVREERSLAMRLDELYRLLGETAAERGLVVHVVDLIDDLGPAQNRQRRELPPFEGGPHVVGVGNAEVSVEALVGRQKLGLVAQVPFAEAAGGVAGALENLGDRDLVRVQAVRVARKQHGVSRSPCQTDAARVAAGHQRRPRGRADRRRDVERRQLHSLPGHAVQIRRAVDRRAERPDVTVAHVVDKDHYEVRPRRPRSLTGKTKAVRGPQARTRNHRGHEVATSHQHKKSKIKDQRSKIRNPGAPG